MATEQFSKTRKRKPGRGRVCRAPETDLQAAYRARGDGIQNAVNTLVEQATRGYQRHQIRRARPIGEMIAQLDKKLSAQMNEIMHAPEFQQLEGAWRGLKYLVFQSETDAMLKIRVMNSRRTSSTGICGCIRTPPGTRAAVQEDL